MRTKVETATVEFYGDPLHIRLLVAVVVPRNRMQEQAEAFGRLYCKLNHLDTVEAELIDEDGEIIDKIVVHR